MLIRITKVPEGQAPLEVRQEWVGVTMKAFTFPGATFAHGLVTGKRVEMKPGFFVDKEHALSQLAKKDLVAASWFLEHADPRFSEFVFGADEAEIFMGDQKTRS